MAAYMIARVEVKDAVAFAKYAEGAGAATDKFGGRYLARGGELIGLENHEDDGKRVVIIEFPDLGAAKAWYNSPEYQVAREHRVNSAFGRFMVVDGVK